ncbi:MAG: DUF938 domain-containing protein [Polyangiaceae bacterium]
MTKRFSAAAERNRQPILEVLREIAPDVGYVLEIASGSGQHVEHFARALPALVFQPSDPSPEARTSVDLYAREAGLTNVRPARDLDVLQPNWDAGVGLAMVDVVVCINMIHIAPWEATRRLFEGASRLLGTGSPLLLYGPYRFGGVFLAPSNEAFSQSLRERDPAWGVRDRDDVVREGRDAGFVLDKLVALPANNHALVFRRA